MNESPEIQQIRQRLNQYRTAWRSGDTKVRAPSFCYGEVLALLNQIDDLERDLKAGRGR